MPATSPLSPTVSPTSAIPPRQVRFVLFQIAHLAYMILPISFLIDYAVTSREQDPSAAARFNGHEYGMPATISMTEFIFWGFTLTRFVSEVPPALARRPRSHQKKRRRAPSSSPTRQAVSRLSSPPTQLAETWCLSSVPCRLEGIFYLLTYLLTLQIEEIFSTSPLSEGVRVYFLDPWNIIDMLTNVLIVPCVTMRCAKAERRPHTAGPTRTQRVEFRVEFRAGLARPAPPGWCAPPRTSSAKDATRCRSSRGRSTHSSSSSSG